MGKIYRSSIRPGKKTKKQKNFISSNHSPEPAKESSSVSLGGPPAASTPSSEPHQTPQQRNPKPSCHRIPSAEPHRNGAFYFVLICRWFLFRFSCLLRLLVSFSFPISALRCKTPPAKRSQNKTRLKLRQFVIPEGCENEEKPGRKGSMKGKKIKVGTNTAAKGSLISERFAPVSLPSLPRRCGVWG